MSKVTERKFRAELGGDAAYRIPLIKIPFDVEAAFGKASARVVATVNGYSWKTTVLVYGANSYIGVRAPVREAAGVAVGDRLKVRLVTDEHPGQVEVPEALTVILGEDAAAREFFEGLSFDNRRQYVEWIAAAENEPARFRRAKIVSEMLRKGIKDP